MSTTTTPPGTGSTDNSASFNWLYPRIGTCGEPMDNFRLSISRCRAIPDLIIRFDGERDGWSICGSFPTYDGDDFQIQEVAFIPEFEDDEPRPPGNGKQETSNVTEALIALLRERDAKGRSTYEGKTLDRTDLTAAQWLDHQTEELLDAAGYAQAAKRTVLELERKLAEANATLAYITKTLAPFDCGAAPVEELARRAARAAAATVTAP